MKTNFLKSFVAMLAIAATVCFAGCKDEDNGEDIVPQIAISESTLAFTNAEETKTLAIESNADWTATVPESADWVTVNPISGHGNKSVTIAVAENNTGKAREAEVKFSAMHPTYGPYDTKKLTISQSANEQEIEQEKAIYSDNFDNGEGSKNENNQWPAVTDCANPQGSAAANVAYKVNGKVTVRNSGKPSNDGDYSSYNGSGTNKVFFGTLPASLVVENIALPADQQNYVLSFGANRYDGTAGVDNTFKNAELIVSVSKDGTAWTPIEYSFAEGVDLNGKWNLAEASFKLAEVPEALYIQFDAKIASIISIDDIKLATGGAGEQEVVFPEAPVVEDIEGTVTEVLEAEQGANVKAIDATVVAVSSRAYLLTDGTSYVLAYMSEGAPEVVVGDKVTVEGQMGSYGTPAVPQIINPVATKTGTVENFAQPEAAVIDAAALDAYKDNFAIKYVKIADANLVKSGNYWNFSVEGASSTGSLAYPTAEMCPDANSGKKVTIYGYVIYLSGASSQYVNVIATSVEVTGEGEGPYEGADVPETDDADICVDFSNAEVYPADFPVAKANQVLDATAYTFEGHEFTFAGGGSGNGFYRNTGGYLMLGKQNAYVELPAIEGRALSMVVLTTRKDASNSVQVAIKDAEGNVVEGGKAITLAQLNDKLTYAYALTGTEENTSYRLTVVSAHNTQLVHLDLYYTGDEAADEPVEMTPTAAAEGYQGAKISWTAVEGAEAYVVSVVDNEDIAAVEVGKDAVEATFTGLTDARKYTFAVEAYDAEENVIGVGETAETEVYTLVNWVEPTFEFALSEDKTTYSFVAKDLAATNYFYVGAEVNIYKDGATTPLYTLKHAHGDAWLESAYQYARYLFVNVNQNKGWYWYDGEGNPVTTKDDGVTAKEVTSVPASFFAAGEYTFDYEIAYGVCVNGTWAKDAGEYKSVACDKAEADRVYFETVDNLLRDADNHIERHSAGIETPVALATIEPTLEFTSVTAKAEDYQGAKIEWSAVETATAYKVVVNGTEVEANGELSHTVAPETLTDANEYTFTVKAYKDADLLAQKDATTQVWTLVNTPAPVVTFVDGKLTATNLVDVTGVALKMTVTFTKEGAADAAYTAYSEHYFNSTSDIDININTDQKFKFADFDTFTMWTWDGSTDKANATDAVKTFEPGTYKVAYTAEYYPVVGGIWRDASKIEVASKELAGEKGRITYPAATSVLQSYVEFPGTADDVVIADPDAVPLATPVVTTAVKGNVVTLTWEAVEGAAKYRVSVGDETSEVEATTFEYEGEYETEYTFNVVAVAADTTANTDSEPATATATTEAAPVVEPGKISELLTAATTAAGESLVEASLTDIVGNVYKGVVVGSNKNKNLNSQIAIVDNGATAEGSGIIVYGNSLASSIEAGTTVTIEITESSIVSPYSGQIQLKNVTVTATEDAAVTVTPVELTAAQFNAGNYTGMYVKVAGLTYAGNAGDVWSASGTTSTNFKSGSENVVVRTYAGAAWAGEVISPAQTNGSLSGVVSLYNGTNQLYPQSAADVADFELTTPYIFGTTPASVSFAAEGGTQDVAIDWVNCDGLTPSLRGLSTPFDASWDSTNNVIKVTCEADDAENTQTLTISVDGGNSIDVIVSKVAAGQAAEDTAKITFDDTAKRTEYSEEIQVWQENGIVVTNKQASSTSKVGDYYNPARFYKSTSLNITAPGNIKTIVFHCNTTSYATALALGTTSGKDVTITCDGTSTSYDIATMANQVRVDSIEVTYEK